MGNIVLNDAMTSASLSPATPTSGQSFSLTGYQTVVNIPASLASAAAALQPNLEGSATAQIDAEGASPAKTPVGPLNFNVPIPSPVPDAGVTLSLPSPSQTVSGFTASGGPITIHEDATANLTLTVSGSPLSLSCQAFPNDSVTPSGITTTTPTGDPISPVIAVAGGTGTTTTTTTTSPTAAPTTLTTSLSGNGQSGGAIVVPSGTSVVDQATLSGDNSSSAGGTVTYRVLALFVPSFHFSSHEFTDWIGWGWQPVENAGTFPVTNGEVPPSNTVTLDVGVYFWRVSYSGDTLNAPSRSQRFSEVEIVLPPPNSPTGLGWMSIRCFNNVHTTGHTDGNGNGNGNDGNGNGNGTGNRNGNGERNGNGNGHDNGNGNGNGDGGWNGNGNGGGTAAGTATGTGTSS